MSSQRYRILYIGGTGTISWACVNASVAAGMDVYVMNRGISASLRPLPDGATGLLGDIRDQNSTANALGDLDFDAIVNMLTFTADHAHKAVSTFRGRTDQYVHVSSTSVYDKDAEIPYIESSPRLKPGSAYAQGKVAAEEVFVQAYASEGFPVTIIRPSHTYDEVRPPVPGGWTVIDRICRGAEIVVPGDGTSLWTITHASEFAVGLIGLLGNPRSIGEAFHVVSDEVYSWDQIYATIAAAAGVSPRLVHIPSEFLSLAAPEWRWSEIIPNELKYSAIFDNRKICEYVPAFVAQVSFQKRVVDLFDWRARYPRDAITDPAVDDVIDRLVFGYHEARKVFSSLGVHASGRDGDQLSR